MGKGEGNNRTLIRQRTTHQNTIPQKLSRFTMVTGPTMEEMVGCMLAQCVSELVRIKVANW